MELQSQQPLQLSSPAFADDALIPPDFTCDGENISPPLRISGVPEDTKSLALLLDDPDSPSGSFTHWLIYNLSPNDSDIHTGLIPEGCTEVINSFGDPGYGGPCPHQGEHRYVFTLYALDIQLEIELKDKPTFETAINGHVLAKAELKGRYQRKTT